MLKMKKDKNQKKNDQVEVDNTIRLDTDLKEVQDDKLNKRIEK